jgi:hypothetical protein
MLVYLICQGIGLKISVLNSFYLFFIFMKEITLIVFENRVLTRIFGPKRDEVTEAWINYIMRCSICYTPHKMLLE